MNLPPDPDDFRDQLWPGPRSEPDWGLIAFVCALLAGGIAIGLWRAFV